MNHTQLLRALYMYLLSPIVMVYYTIVEKTSWLWTVVSGIFGPGIMMTMIPGMLGKEIRGIVTYTLLFISGEAAYVAFIVAVLRKILM